MDFLLPELYLMLMPDGYRSQLMNRDLRKQRYDDDIKRKNWNLTGRETKRVWILRWRESTRIPKAPPYNLGNRPDAKITTTTHNPNCSAGGGRFSTYATAETFALQK